MILLILLGLFIALLILSIYDNFVTRTVMKEGYIVWKTRGDKLWWEYTPAWYLHFDKLCREAKRRHKKEI